MDQQLQADFLAKWAKYFPGADLPLALYYSDDPGGVETARAGDGHRCLIGDLAKARRNGAIAFDSAGTACFGGKRYLGFSPGAMPNFNEFISCGIPGKLEGERYKKTPEIVDEFFANQTELAAPARYAVFKRWDMLTAADDPRVVVFFAPPDVLSGLFTLAGFGTAADDPVIAPFGAGCATIAQYPMLECDRERPRAVLGMFDVSARPSVPENLLTFAVPMPLFTRMVADMDESFLITGSWHKVARRIGKG